MQGENSVHATDKNGYSIGQVSRQTGVHIETVRYYERIGLVPEPDRTSGGNRQYSHADLKRLFFVKRCRELGFSLDEIRALMEMVDRDDFTCGQVHEMTIAHLATIQQKLKDLRRLEKSLKQMAAQCSKGDVPECPVIDTLYGA